MELNDFLGLIKKKKQTIISLMVIFFVLGLILTVIQPFKYSSQLRLLVVQSTNQASPDAYAVARSNEYLSGVLSKITYSGSFYSRVINAGFNIDQNYFGQTNKQISKKWNKTISAKALSDTGIIQIVAYHPNRQQAEQIARAVGQVLMTQNANYHGLGDSVKIKLLDEPITSAYPVRPNVVLNLILAIFLGFIFSLSYIYLLPESKHDLRIFSRKHKKEKINSWLPAEVPVTKVSEAPVKPVQDEEIKGWPAVEDILEEEFGSDYPDPNPPVVNFPQASESEAEIPANESKNIDNLFNNPEQENSEQGLDRNQLFR